jgi:hypothetical protein
MLGDSRRALDAMPMKMSHEALLIQGYNATTGARQLFRPAPMCRPASRALAALRYLKEILQ